MKTKGYANVHIMQGYGWGERTYQNAHVEIVGSRIEIRLQEPAAPKGGVIGTKHINVPESICSVFWLDNARANELMEKEGKAP